MAKRRQTMECVLPRYQKDRGRWRKAILECATEACDARGVEYDDGTKLQVGLVLYMDGNKRLLIHDVDNRLKDVLDALQGRFPGRKAERARRLIKNDNCVYKVSVEKRPVPKKYKNRVGGVPGGKLTVGPYSKTALR